METQLAQSKKEQIKDVICKRGRFEREDIQDSHNLTSDLGLNSLDKVEIIMDLELSFDVTIPDEDAELVETVQDIFDLFEKL